MTTKNKRRSFIKWSTGAAGALVFFQGQKNALGAVCGLTPAQTPGPFYPGEAKFTTDHDLTQIPGNPVRALGQVVYIKGKVVDQACAPLKDVNVEIWQACASGKYNNQRDPNPAPLDPNFKYWAEVFTDEKGEYWFKTIIPGAYPAAADWTRPPHIHFKISGLGYKELVTQLYFKNQEHNDTDLILQDLPPGDRERVVVELTDAGPDYEPDSLIGSFDITLVAVK